MLLKSLKKEFEQMGDSFVVKGCDIYLPAFNSNKYANRLFDPIFPPPYFSFCGFLVRKQLEKLMIDFSSVGAGGEGKKDHLMSWVVWSKKFGILKMALLG